MGDFEVVLVGIMESSVRYHSDKIDILTSYRKPVERQFPNHYAIRAGRNLPDKEFRYLRTVIVTALNFSEGNINLSAAFIPAPQAITP